MDNWYSFSYALSDWLRQLSRWIETHKTEALLWAVTIPLLYFSIRTIIRRRARMRQLESEHQASQQQSRLPPETLERNRKEEKRYREHLKAKAKHEKQNKRR